MSAGTVIESGRLPDGTEYRIWECRRTGKRIVYIGDDIRQTGKVGHRRSVKWLRKTLREAR